jgi:hypothetical protein
VIPAEQTDNAVIERQGLAWRVIEQFDAEGIAYCHWKSNEHLLAAMTGETDLDVLIDGARLDDAYRIFSAEGCRRGRTSAARNEPGLEDFLGHDEVTGRLVHFHVHWRLATGERHLKRFRLPWERHVLATRVRDEATGCYTSAPAVEVVLVAVRASLKLRWRDQLRMGMSRRPKRAVANEIEWLMKSTTMDDVAFVATRWLGERGAEAIVEVVNGGATRGNLARVRRATLRVVGDQTTHSSLAAPVVRWRRELAWFQRASHGATTHGRCSTDWWPGRRAPSSP